MPDGEIRVCPNDRSPVIFTFKFSGHEYVCTECGWLGSVLGTPRALATPELVARAAEVQAAWDAQEGLKPPPQDLPRPSCGGCGETAVGYLDSSGKPPHWYSRTHDGVTEYACSRTCIPSNQVVLPW